MDAKQITPMRLYSNWDMDKTSSNSIPRVLSMLFTQLVLTKNFKFFGTNSLVLAIRQKGQRRTLRSGDLSISSQTFTYRLGISFIIQYCHFIKKRSNVLQILLQRRKRYKNRQIPGYKTLAIGYLNLDEVLQNGGPKQVSIWDMGYLKSQRSSLREFHVGTIYISNSYSQQITAESSSSEQPYRRQKQDLSKLGRVLYDTSEHSILHDGKKSHQVIEQSDEDEFSSGAESSEFDDFCHFAEPHSSMSRISHHSNMKPRYAKDRGRQRKYKALLKQKNIKQRIAALIRRFRQDDETIPTKDIILPELELQEIFDELDDNDNVSDYSGPELLEEPDRSSTITNTRPGLRPFFGSRSTILAATAIMLEECEKSGQFLSDDASGQSLTFADLDQRERSSSCDNDEPPPEPKPDRNAFETINSHIKHNFSEKIPDPIQESPKSRFVSKSSANRHHSNTFNTVLTRSLEDISRLGNEDKILHNQMNSKLPSSTTYSDLITHLEEMSMTSTSIISSYVWLCSTADLPWLSRINSHLLGSVMLIDCPSPSEVNTVLQAFINRIQKFCNTNSIAPSTTTIGILGGDLLLSNVLQSYVQLLQHKCQEEWANYLRFSLIVTPTSAVGRLLAQVADGGYSEAAWKALNRIASNFTADSRPGPLEHAEIRDCLLFGITSSTPKRTTNLSIGEIMLQLLQVSSTPYDTPNKSQIFVPFLAEILTKGNEKGDPICETSSPLHYMDLKQSNQQNATEISESRCEIPEKGVSHSALGPPSRLLNKLRNGIGKSLDTESPFQCEDEPSSSRRMEKMQSTPRNEFLCQNGPTLSPSETRELHIEYWIVNSGALGMYTHSEISTGASPGSLVAQNQNLRGNKYSIKAPIRMLSIAREPMSHLLSILFVKEKKDKVLQKLGRKNKLRSSESGYGNTPTHFDTQSRVVSGVSHIVCMRGNLGSSGEKRMPPMDVYIDGVLWNNVRYFKVIPQWQTHVKIFPVSFPLVPTVNVWPL